MKTPAKPIPQHFTQATLLLDRSLRDLYRSVRHIQPHDPHAAARLARIADQAEYFLQQWPEQDWPTVSAPDRPVPTKAVLLTWLATVKKNTGAEQIWSYARWQQATTTLLAALLPFA